MLKTVDDVIQWLNANTEDLPDDYIEKLACIIIDSYSGNILDDNYNIHWCWDEELDGVNVWII